MARRDYIREGPADPQEPPLGGPDYIPYTEPVDEPPAEQPDTDAPAESPLPEY